MSNMSSKWDSDPEVQRLREYLRIPSVHPNVDYRDCVKFLKRQGEEIGLGVQVVECAANKPTVVLTWQGTQPDLTSVLLNSHMDVVPVHESHWTHPPFGAVISEDGFLYGRGTQDMKSVGMIHLEAVRRLKHSGIRLKRTVHLSFVPDEEIGGADGMVKFTKSQVFKDMNIGFEMDESCPHKLPDTYYVFYGERTNRPLTIKCSGTPGHGSLLGRNTAGEKFHFMIDKLMKFREKELKRLEQGALLGDVTTVNLTKIEGGVQVNVLPNCLSASFDVRIAPHVDHDEFELMIQTWCKEAGEGVSFEYIQKCPVVKNTSIDGSVPFYTALRDVAKEMGITLDAQVCPGATDARHVRSAGVPAISLSPFQCTPLLLHAHNERIHVEEFKRGIQFFEAVVKAVANV